MIAVFSRAKHGRHAIAPNSKRCFTEETAVPHYVMLNFEDTNPNAGPGKVKAVKGDRPAGIGAAAEGTLKMYRRRATAKKKKVVYYSCQELIARDGNGTLSRDDVKQVRKDCESAHTIGIIIHGTPTDTDQGFSTAGGAVCTWKQLAKLALLLLPVRAQTYSVALIMCYGARSADAEFDHRGAIPPDKLRSSFAYKLFRALCVARNVRMTARTGAVSTDGALDHTVETEEQVFAVIDKQKVRQLRTLNKAAMDLQKTQLLTTNNVTAQQFDVMLNKFATDPLIPPANQVERFAKDYVPYSPYVNLYVDNMYGRDRLGNRSKYGKFIYSFQGGVLTIVSRYDSGSGPNYELYRGPLL
jgi:hypothetical protein